MFNIFKSIIIILFLFSVFCLTQGCRTVVTKTEMVPVFPEIPESLLSPCDPIQQGDITTNGDLLMSYISLQSSYAVCASKVSSIKLVLQSYSTVYNQPDDK